MIAIVDYGVGNIFSLCCSFQYIGANAVLTSDADEIRKADRVLLPGVGAFGDAAVKLRLQIAFFVGLQDSDVMSMGRQLVCKADQHFFRPAEDQLWNLNQDIQGL